MNRFKVKGYSVDDMRERLAQAGALQAKIDRSEGGREAVLEEVFATCGLVFAVWPERVMPSLLGHGLAIPAGLNAMAAHVMANLPFEAETATVPCASFREAQALCEKYGDERPVH